MKESEARQLLRDLCDELDEVRTERTRARRKVLPVVLGAGLAILSSCSETPIHLPYMGPMYDGWQPIVDVGVDADAGLDTEPDALADGEVDAGDDQYVRPDQQPGDLGDE